MAAVFPINVESMIQQLKAGEYIGKAMIDSREYGLFRSKEDLFVLTGEIDESPVEVYVKRATHGRNDPVWRVIEAYQMENGEKFSIRQKGPFQANVSLAATASLEIDRVIRRYAIRP